MLRHEQVLLWILALLTAGLGVNIHLAAWAAEMNLWNATVWAFGTEFTAKAAVPVMYHLADIAAHGAAILLAVGLLVGSWDSAPKERKTNVRA
jgi:hypothetical protein